MTQTDYTIKLMRNILQACFLLIWEYAAKP